MDRSCPAGFLPTCEATESLTTAQKQAGPGGEGEATQAPGRTHNMRSTRYGTDKHAQAMISAVGTLREESFFVLLAWSRPRCELDWRRRRYQLALDELRGRCEPTPFEPDGTGWNAVGAHAQCACQPSRLTLEQERHRTPSQRPKKASCSAAGGWATGKPKPASLRALERQTIDRRCLTVYGPPSRARSSTK